MNGDQLKQLRTSQGMSQDKLAQLLNASLDRKYGSAMISRWETGKAPIPPHVSSFLGELGLNREVPDEHLQYEPETDFPPGETGDTTPPPPGGETGQQAASFPLPLGSSPYAKVCEELFELVATGVGMVGAVTGSEKLMADGRIIEADKKNLGKAYGKLAETNATFRNMLQGMTGGGAWLEVALVSGITAGKVMRNHQRPAPPEAFPDTANTPDSGNNGGGVTMHGDGDVITFPTTGASL